MKIEELNPNPAATQIAAVRPEKPEAAEAQGDAAARQKKGADKVELSPYMPVVPASERRHEVRAERAERVEELKEQIKAGTYEVPGKAVAEKMLSKLVTKGLK